MSTRVHQVFPTSFSYIAVRVQNVVSVERVSGLYETRAQYVSEQPDFLNAVCRVSTSLEPRPLLAALKDIEQRLGRAAKGIRCVG